MAGTGRSTVPTETVIQDDHAIDIVTPPHPPHLIPPSPVRHYLYAPKLPSDIYLSDDEKKNYLSLCLPLYEAALKGDWQVARRMIGRCPDLINASINKNSETALHVASSTKHTHFVKEVVNLMMPEDLELQNTNWNTALCLSAAAGTVKIAELLVKKNPELLWIRGTNNMSPLLIAALYGHKDMLFYLYAKTNNMTGEEWTDSDRVMVLHACVTAHLYDIALDLLHYHKKELALAVDKNALHVLAGNPSVFIGTRQPIFWRILNTIFPGQKLGPAEKKCQALEIVQIIWREIVQLRDDDIWNIIRGPQEVVKITESDQPCVRYFERKSYPYRLLFVAAALGNTKFIIELIRLCPELIWRIDDNNRTIFHVAVYHRQESVYNLLYEIGSMKDLITAFRDVNGNTILHLAAMKPVESRRHYVSGGVALQMQREILWFQEVETVMNHVKRGMRNEQGKTARDLFIEQHVELRGQGERWMKDTAAQCMVVAALIATMMFAAAFTLPGGNNQDSGHPIFKHKSAFMVFVITDAVSLFSSSASILAFLSILTARYAEKDFLVSLPLRLMIGLLTLFISVTTMMIAFSVSFFLVYTEGMKWVPYLITGLAGLPVVLFALLHYHLFIDVLGTFYNSMFLFRPKKHAMY